MTSIQQWHRLIAARAILIGLEFAGIFVLINKVVVYGGLEGSGVPLTFLVISYFVELLIMVIYGSGVHMNELLLPEWKVIRGSNQWTPSRYITHVTIGAFWSLLGLIVIITSGATQIQGTIATVLLFILFPILFAKIQELLLVLDSHRLTKLMIDNEFPLKSAKENKE